MTPQGSRWITADWRIVAALMVVTALLRLPFVYDFGVSDPDVAVMAAGMARGLSPDVSFDQSLLYGLYISPGVYLAFAAVYPVVSGDPGGVLPFLNTVGVWAGVLLVAPLFLLFRERFGSQLAAACTLITVTAPLVWESGTDFHPVVPATLFLLLAVLAAGRSSRPAFLAAIVLGWAALMTRVEVALVVPALLVLAAGRFRAGDMMALFGIPLAGFVLITALLPSGGGAGGMADYAGEFMAAYFAPAVLPRASVWLVLGAGMVTCLAALVSLFRIASAGPEDRRYLLAAGLWAAGPILFWILNPIPLLRHYFLAVPALVWLAANGFLRWRSPRAVWIGALVILALNLALPEALYRQYNRNHPDSPKTPHGAFFYRHGQIAEHLGAYRAMQNDLRRSLARDRGVSLDVDWEGYGYALYELARTRPAWNPCDTDSVDAEVSKQRYCRGQQWVDVAVRDDLEGQFRLRSHQGIEIP